MDKSGIFVCPQGYPQGYPQDNLLENICFCVMIDASVRFEYGVAW